MTCLHSPIPLFDRNSQPDNESRFITARLTVSINKRQMLHGGGPVFSVRDNPVPGVKHHRLMIGVCDTPFDVNFRVETPDLETVGGNFAQLEQSAVFDFGKADYLIAVRG